MADQGRTAVEADVARRRVRSVPPLDPEAVERAYRLHRARRRARVEHRRERRRAGIRFWLFVLALVGASFALAILIVQEVRRLFGV